MLWVDVGRVFVHGLLFWLLTVALFVGWFFLAFVLVNVGYLLGLFVGFVVLFLAFGYINGALAGYLWGFERESGWLYCFLHGLLLFVLVAGVNFFFVYVPSLMWRGWAVWMVAFVGGVFLDGLFGRLVAGWFKRSPDKPSDLYVGE